MFSISLINSLAMFYVWPIFQFMIHSILYVSLELFKVEEHHIFLFCTRRNCRLRLHGAFWCENYLHITVPIEKYTEHFLIYWTSHLLIETSESQTYLVCHCFQRIHFSSSDTFFYVVVVSLSLFFPLSNKYHWWKRLRWLDCFKQRTMFVMTLPRIA